MPPIPALETIPVRLSLLLLTAVALGCGKDDSDKGTTPPPGTLPPPGPTGPGPTGPGTKPQMSEAELLAAKPDHTVTPAAWHAEFKADKEAAGKKYAGKVIELTGTVATVAENEDAGISFVHLKVDKDIFGVRCATKDMALWEKVVDGCEVTVRGKLADGAIFAGELLPAAVVKVDKNPSLSATAADLVKQFKADATKLGDSHNGKWVYVEGEFVSSGEVKNGGIYFVLKGDADCPIKCHVPLDAEKRMKTLRPGQKLKVLGQFYAFKGDKELSLSMCRFKGLQP